MKLTELRRGNDGRYRLEDDRSSVTSTGNSKTFKVEILHDHVLRNLYSNNLTVLIRADVMSFHGAATKFKAYVGLQKTSDPVKITFGCTCTTGNRLFGCIHTTVIVLLLAYELK